MSTHPGSCTLTGSVRRSGTSIASFLHDNPIPFHLPYNVYLYRRYHIKGAYKLFFFFDLEKNKDELLLFQVWQSIVLAETFLPAVSGDGGAETHTHAHPTAAATNLLLIFGGFACSSANKVYHETERCKRSDLYIYIYRHWSYKDCSVAMGSIRYYCLP